MTIVAGNYEVSETLTAEQLVERLQDILRSPSSGTVTLHRPDGTPIGSLKFKLGQLLWASSPEHRWRRWQRLTRQLCPQIQDYPLETAPHSEDWEYQTLTQLIRQNKVDRIAAIALLQQSLAETLFDILQLSRQGCKLSSSAISDAPDSPMIENSAALLSEAEQAWQAWVTAGLADCSPNAAPSVRNAAALQQRTSPQTYQTLSNLLNGRSSLRELALTMGQNLQMLAQTLLAYAQWDLIGLNEIADLPSPGQNPGPNPGQNSGQNSGPNLGQNQGQDSSYPSTRISEVASDAPLVMCIDDNPKVCEMLGKILGSAGYRFVSVQDSLQTLPVLLERKPDFIFLDLVMPVASGYEVCAQIRRISMFKDLPIVILTGNDGIIDRIRSKASGSTDFISKPLDVSKVLAAVKQYLPDRVPRPV